MATIILAPKGNTAPADVQLDGKTDMTVIAGYARTPGNAIRVLKGTANLNGGTSADPSGGGYLRLAEGVTLEGDPDGGTVFEAPSSIVRITVDKPNATLRNFKLTGRGHIQVFGTSGNVTIENVWIRQADGAGNYIDLKSNCTAAFLFYAKPGQTLRGVHLKGCTAEKSYHHGFSAHVYGGNEGGTFADFVIEDCEAISCGSGLLRPRDWSTGFLFADTGNLVNVRLKGCTAIDAYQSGFHCDGDWDGHRQNVTDYVYEDCVAIRCGHRCHADSVEKFRCGFYLQSVRMFRCGSIECAGPGFGIKNEKSGSLIVEECVDEGSLYGMILEYPAPNARVQFTSRKAVRRAFQGQVTGSNGLLDLTLVSPPVPAITFGRTQRIDYLDCPNHAETVRTKYDALGYTISGKAVTIRCEVPPVVEVWARSKMDVGAITYLPLPDDPLEPEEPEEEPDGGGPVPPPVVPTGGIVYRPETGVVYVSGDGTSSPVIVPFPIPSRLKYFRAEWVADAE